MIPFDDFLTAQIARIQAIPNRKLTRRHRSSEEENVWVDRRREAMIEAGHDGWDADRVLMGCRGVVGDVEVRR